MWASCALLSKSWKSRGDPRGANHSQTELYFSAFSEQGRHPDFSLVIEQGFFACSIYLYSPLDFEMSEHSQESLLWNFSFHSHFRMSGDIYGPVWHEFSLCAERVNKQEIREASTGNQTDGNILSEDFHPAWRQQVEQHFSRIPDEGCAHGETNRSMW